MILPKTTEVRPITDRAAWLSWRREVLTGTDMGAIAGVSRWTSPLAVWADKAGRLEPLADNNFLRRGRWFEPAILHALRELFPRWKIVKANVFLVDKTRRLGGTPDFVAIDPERPGIGVIDGKVVTRRVFNRDWLGDVDEDYEGDLDRVTVPIEHQLQALLYGKLAGASWLAIAPMIHGEYRTDQLLCPVELHEGAWQRLLVEAAFFWREFDAGRRPPHRADAGDAEVLRALYPRERNREEEVDLSSVNWLSTRLAERAALMVAIDEADKEKRSIETDIIALMGDRGIGTLPGWRIGFRLESQAAKIMPAWEKRVLRITRRKVR